MFNLFRYFFNRFFPPIFVYATYLMISVWIFWNAENCPPQLAIILEKLVTTSFYVQGAHFLVTYVIIIIFGMGGIIYARLNDQKPEEFHIPNRIFVDGSSLLILLLTGIYGYRIFLAEGAQALLGVALSSGYFIEILFRHQDEKRDEYIAYDLVFGNLMFVFFYMMIHAHYSFLRLEMPQTNEALLQFSKINMIKTHALTLMLYFLLRIFWYYFQVQIVAAVRNYRKINLN